MIFWIAVLVVLIDQLTKYWAVQVLYQQDRTIVIFKNFFRLTYATNRGGAAGMLGDYPQLLTFLSIAALFIIIWWARKIPLDEKVARIGFGAVLGGATGNLLDRLFRGGFLIGTYVVDFFEAHWYERFHWPIFNVADSAICIGIGLILFAHFRSHRAASCPVQKDERREANDDGKSRVAGTSD